MTVSTTASVVTYLGNGVTTVFPFSFIGVNAADLEVLYTDSDGVTTTLGTSTYTLVITATASGALWGIGGTVTYPNIGSAISTGTSLTIQRIVPYEQNISISNQGAFYPQAVEQALDLLELQIQQLVTELDYTIRVPTTDYTPPDVLPSAVDRANGYLTFDNNGQPTVTTTVPTPSTITYAAPRRIVTTGTATNNILTSDSFGGVSVYQSSTPVTTLQLPVGYGPYPVFDGSLNSSTYPIRILPPAAKTIQGATDYYLTADGQSVTFYNDGTQILIG